MAANKTSDRGSTSSASSGAEHHPYVPDDANLPEFTWGAVLAGSLLGIVFGAASLYLVLRIGMTVSASIPVAVLSITLFRVLSRLFGLRKASILENNIVQTAGSAGESIAFGVGVTMPALMILGFEMDIGRVMVVAILGGLLGILMMIPLRRAFIVKQHDTLKYPEGTACAEVLIVGEQGGSSAATVFIGFGVAFVYQFLNQSMKLWKEIPSKSLSWFKGAMPAIEVNPALLGVGYIIGTRISCIMAAGGVLASFVLIPAIRLFGDGLNQPVYPAAVKISSMTEHDISQSYVLYIGAGAVTAGGLISLVQALPLIVGSVVAAVKDLRSARSSTGSGAQPKIRRTDRDLPLWLVGVGALVLVAAIWGTSILHQYVEWIPQLEMNGVGAMLIVLFGFLFVTVSSRLTGEIGSSSNPISGMTVATLLFTCIVFLWWHSDVYKSNPAQQNQDLLAALSVAGVVCVAASNGGTTSQDLKTGYLIGATPRLQQLAILIGAITSALVIGSILILFNNAGTVYSKLNLPTLGQPLDVKQLTDSEPGPAGDSASYHVWRATEDNEQGAPPGKYLVDDAGKIRYLVDPGINGKLDHRDDGTEVSKYNSPKATLMAFIAQGILRQKLPWALVLLGVAIALVLELCGVPSLPFSVGVYLPLSTSAPIFVGGLIRYVSDRWARTPSGKPRTTAESDMSPGVLISTGYIAGGAIAGVLVAMLALNSNVSKTLSQWEYRTVAVPDEPTFDKQLDRLEAEQLGISSDTLKQLDTTNPQKKSPPTDEEVKLDKLRVEKRDLHWAIIQLNQDQFAQYSVVPAGATLKLPNDKTLKIDRERPLGEIAKEALNENENPTSVLFKLNEALIPLPKKLPANLPVRLPQTNALPLVMFAALSVFLLIVGIGWVLRGSAIDAEAPRDGGSAGPASKPIDRGKPPIK